MWQFQLMPIGRGKDELDLMVKPEQRIQLFRKWEKLLSEKRYCMADFWNSGVLTRGCVAYGRSGGYIYIDWHGNVTPCAFIPYYVDNVYDLYENGKTLSDALVSDYDIFRNAVLTKEAKPEDEKAKEALESDDYFKVLKAYDEQLQQLTEKIWQNEYLNV